jgi:hypothetical protein
MTAQVPHQRTIMAVLLVAAHQRSPTSSVFPSLWLRTPRDSFDLPPRPPISKRTAAGRVVVDMSPLIEREDSSGTNAAINRARRI